jgi:hypothetical protein
VRPTHVPPTTWTRDGRPINKIRRWEVPSPTHGMFSNMVTRYNPVVGQHVLPRA